MTTPMHESLKKALAINKASGRESAIAGLAHDLIVKADVGMGMAKAIAEEALDGDDELFNELMADEDLDNQIDDSELDHALPSGEDAPKEMNGADTAPIGPDTITAPEFGNQDIEEPPIEEADVEIGSNPDVPDGGDPLSIPSPSIHPSAPQPEADPGSPPRADEAQGQGMFIDQPQVVGQLEQACKLCQEVHPPGVQCPMDPSMPESMFMKWSSRLNKGAIPKIKPPKRPDRVPATVHTKKPHSRPVQRPPIHKAFSPNENLPSLGQSGTTDGLAKDDPGMADPRMSGIEPPLERNVGPDIRFKHGTIGLDQAFSRDARLPEVSNSYRRAAGVDTAPDIYRQTGLNSPHPASYPDIGSYPESGEPTQTTIPGEEEYIPFDLFQAANKWQKRLLKVDYTDTEDQEKPKKPTPQPSPPSQPKKPAGANPNVSQDTKDKFASAQAQAAARRQQRQAPKPEAAHSRIVGEVAEGKKPRMGVTGRAPPTIRGMTERLAEQQRSKPVFYSPEGFETKDPAEALRGRTSAMKPSYKPKDPSVAAALENSPRISMGRVIQSMDVESILNEAGKFGPDGQRAIRFAMRDAMPKMIMEAGQPGSPGHMRLMEFIDDMKFAGLINDGDVAYANRTAAQERNAMESGIKPSPLAGRADQGPVRQRPAEGGIQQEDIATRQFQGPQGLREEMMRERAKREGRLIGPEGTKPEQLQGIHQTERNEEQSAMKPAKEPIGPKPKPNAGDEGKEKKSFNGLRKATLGQTIIGGEPPSNPSALNAAGHPTPPHPPRGGDPYEKLKKVAGLVKTIQRPLHNEQAEVLKTIKRLQEIRKANQ